MSLQLDFVLCFVFCVWINSFSHEQVSLFSLFSFFFFFFFLISFGLWEKKKQRQRREWEEKKEEEEAAERMREKKNPEEREIIDKISSCSNILMQEIRLLMYNSSLDLMSYCLLAKKKRVFASLLEVWIVDILSIFSPYFTYALTVRDALSHTENHNLLK